MFMERNNMARAIIALVVGLASASAFAEEENKAASAEAAPAQQEAPAAAEAAPAPAAVAPARDATPATPAAAPSTKPKTTHPPAAKSKAAHAPADAAPKPRSATGLSQSKFLGILYSEIAKRRPEKNLAGPGVVSANFRVNSSGKIDNVSIKSSTSPAHAEIGQKLLAKVQAPPPPGGIFEGVQDFKFH
jgi:outer membrane biosynthesis protein TonB